MNMHCVHSPLCAYRQNNQKSICINLEHVCVYCGVIWSLLSQLELVLQSARLQGTVVACRSSSSTLFCTGSINNVWSGGVVDCGSRVFMRHDHLAKVIPCSTSFKTASTALLPGLNLAVSASTPLTDSSVFFHVVPELVISSRVSSE